jgi:MinD superfamily P-loop ATPase
MRCKACGDRVSDTAILANTEEAFINNECLCSDCLSVSNEENYWMLKIYEKKQEDRGD